jgi:fibronectin type 3 domain-containing protein
MALLFCSLRMVSFTSHAQSGEHGEVFAINDYRQSEKKAVIVKWFAKKVYYKDGFNVYRKSEGESGWIKLNATPVNVKATTPPALAQKDKEIKAFLSVVNKTPYDEFQKGVAKVFIVMKAILSPEFAELLGVIYYDETAEYGKAYQYEVRGILGANEEVINTKSLKIGPYQKEAAPQVITINRKKNGVEFKWQPEELRYYGVNIYRKAPVETSWKKINNQPRNVYKSADQTGVKTYPDVFYFDPASKDSVYEYRLSVVDYYGEEGLYSDVVTLPIIDFDAPLPPLNLETSINVMDLTLSWSIRQSEGLTGFKVYRSAGADSLMKAIHQGILPPDQNRFTDHLLKTGGYYYQVNAVDNNGNEGASEKIFIEVRDVTPPAPPTNVFVKSDTGLVSLTWTANTEADLRGYYIYRSLHDGNHHDNEFIVMNTKPITETTYSEALPRNVRNRFVYAVVAEDQSYNRSKMSAVSVVRLPDATSPAKPLIKNVFIQDDKLVIEWLSNKETDLAGYNIYRSSDSLLFQKVNVHLYPAQTYRYTDNQVTGSQRYFYYIHAVDSAGNTSPPSNVFSGLNKNIGSGTTPPSGVKVEYVKARKEVRINWTLRVGPPLVGAVVFRSQDKTNFRPVTGVLKESGFTDKDVKKGTTYYYQVKAYSNTGTVSQSDVQQTTIEE